MDTDFQEFNRHRLNQQYAFLRNAALGHIAHLITPSSCGPTVTQRIMVHTKFTLYRLLMMIAHL